MLMQLVRWTPTDSIERSQVRIADGLGVVQADMGLPIA
jgi:hypothetical protein